VQLPHVPMQQEMLPMPPMDAAQMQGQMMQPPQQLQPQLQQPVPPVQQEGAAHGQGPLPLPAIQRKGAAGGSSYVGGSSLQQRPVPAPSQAIVQATPRENAY
jgi:hypothetical protein